MKLGSLLNSLYIINLILFLNLNYDDYKEKIAAQKEITRIKSFLLYIVNNFNINVVYPGWCTGYGDYKKTIQEINGAIIEMKSSVKNTPTDYILRLKGAY